MNDTLYTSNAPHLTTDSETNLDANFNAAIKMSEFNYDYETLITLLSSNKIVEKQIAVLNLTEIHSERDAEILVSNLIGQDGKIRESVAFKINELAKNPEYFDYFISENLYGTYLQGIMDINGNVCRQIIDGQWFDNSGFKSYLCEKLPKTITTILNEIEKLSENEKQYKISKRNFQLYWTLEALYRIVDIIDVEKIKCILLKTGNFHDYTIREKTAKILTKINSAKFNELKEKLKDDENYYVRRYLVGVI